MKRHAKCLRKIFILIPLMGVYNMATCQADVMRRTANELDQHADDLDGENDDFGDFLADVVEDW